MATIDRVGSFSISDYDAKLRALQQLSDQASREWQAAAQRGHEARLQALSEQAAAARQLNSLKLEAAQKGLRLAPGSGGGGPGFSAQIGPFSFGTGTESPEFEKTPEQIEREKIDLMERRRQLDQLQQQLDLNQRSLDMPGKTEELRRRVMGSAELMGPPMPGQDSESIMGQAPPEVAGALRQQMRAERGQEAQIFGEEATGALRQAQAEELQGMWIDSSPDTFRATAEGAFSPEELREFGIDSKRIPGMADEYYALQRKAKMPLGREGFRGYAMGAASKEAGTRAAMRELGEDARVSEQSDRLSASAVPGGSQIEERLEGVVQAKLGNIDKLIKNAEFEKIADAVDTVVKSNKDPKVPEKAIREAVREKYSARIAKWINRNFSFSKKGDKLVIKEAMLGAMGDEVSPDKETEKSIRTAIETFDLERRGLLNIEGE